MERKYNAVLLDNDIAANEELEELLIQNCPAIEIAGIYERVNDALLGIVEHKPHILFLDILMPDKNGLDFFELLEKVDVPLQCILVSGHIVQHLQKLVDLELTLYL